MILILNSADISVIKSTVRNFQMSNRHTTNSTSLHDEIGCIKCLVVGPDMLKPIDLEPEEQSQTLCGVVIAVKDKASDITDSVATNMTDSWQQVNDTVSWVLKKITTSFDVNGVTG